MPGGLTCIPEITLSAAGHFQGRQETNPSRPTAAAEWANKRHGTPWAQSGFFYSSHNQPEESKGVICTQPPPPTHAPAHSGDLTWTPAWVSLGAADRPCRAFVSSFFCFSASFVTTLFWVWFKKIFFPHQKRFSGQERWLSG